MNRNNLRKIIKECLNEIVSEYPQDSSIHIPGYAVVGVNGTKQHIIKQLEEALQAAKAEDWKTVNRIVGRKGNGVIPAFVTAIRDFTEGKGIVSHGNQESVKNIS